MPLRPALLLSLLLPVAALASPPATPVPAEAESESVAEVEPALAQRVRMVTTMGEIVIELDAAAAPRTVENFLAYAREGHYNGTVFHRVVPGLLVQGGGFTPDLQPKPSRAPIPNEAGNGLLNRRGAIAAARDRGVVESATTQFFINLADNPNLDPSPGDSPYTAGYAVFGRVVLGMDVVDRIAATPTGAQGAFSGWVPTTPVLIERIDLLEPTAP